MYVASVLLSIGLAAAHSPVAVNPDDTWQVRHMKLEHGFDEFEPRAFFLEHDVDNTKEWDRSDIIRLYGLQKDKVVGDGAGTGSNAETKDITEADRERVYKEILKLMDTDGNGKISMQEWRKFLEDGKELPDFGYGTGHHGDYEYEYEVHHWKQYHQEDDPEVKVMHPEDIEHERLYHQFEHHDDGWADHDASWVRVSQIPAKFLKQRV